MASLDQSDLKLLLRLSKLGKPLEEICEILEVGAETVVAALAQMFCITPKEMRRILTLRKQGESLALISELSSVAVATLLEVFLESSLPADLRNQILTLGREGRSSEDISYSTGISEADVITVLNSIKLQSKGPATEATVIEERRLVKQVGSSREETKSSKGPTDDRSRVKHSRLGEETASRKPEQMEVQCLRRFLSDYGSWNVGSENKFEVTTFSVDHDILITAVGIGSPYKEDSRIEVSVLEIRNGIHTDGSILYRHSKTLALIWNGSDDDKYTKINLTQPVHIRRNTDYTFRIRYDTSGEIWAAGGSPKNSVGGVDFRFSKSSCGGDDEDNNGNATTAGPTRDIYFTLE
jgi:DNA-binding CsgD family transcriptional regulator